MKAEFTAIIEVAPEGGYWAICPEIPGAGDNIRQAIEMILEDRVTDILRGVPSGG